MALLIWPAWGAVIGLGLIARGRERDDLLVVLTGAGFLLVAAVGLAVALKRRSDL